MHAVVAFGGDADPTHVRQVLARAQLVIAADGGAAHIEAAGGQCDVIVGDQDSVRPETLHRARAAGADIRDFPTAKDATDGELALREALSRGATSITIVGALGGPRVDHLLANVALLAHPSLRDVDDGDRRLPLSNLAPSADHRPGAAIPATSSRCWPLPATPTA